MSIVANPRCYILFHIGVKHVKLLSKHSGLFCWHNQIYHFYSASEVFSLELLKHEPHLSRLARKQCQQGDKRSPVRTLKPGCTEVMKFAWKQVLALFALFCIKLLETVECRHKEEAH